MDNMIKRGKSVPTTEQLLDYQLGWDNHETEYGPDKVGETLFIKTKVNGEGDAKVRAVTEGLLKEEFLNYTLPMDEKGKEVDFDKGVTKYTHTNDDSEAEFFGLTAGLISKRADKFDENNRKAYEAVEIDFMSVNPGSRKFQTTTANGEKGSVRTIKFNSINPTYLAYLKDALEQKAVYTVQHAFKDDADSAYGNFTNLNTLKAYLMESANLSYESGVQAIVIRDETTKDDSFANDNSNISSTTSGAAEGSEAANASDSQKNATYKDVNDTWLYVLSPVGGDAKETINTYDENSKEITREIPALEWKPVMPMEYTYHDPKGIIIDGLGIETRNQNESESSVEVHLSDYTRKTIERAYNEADEIDASYMGMKAADIVSSINAKAADDRNTSMTASQLVSEAKNEYSNAIVFTHKTYVPGDEGTDTVRRTDHYISFKDFILDEGTWD